MTKWKKKKQIMPENEKINMRLIELSWNWNWIKSIFKKWTKKQRRERKNQWMNEINKTALINNREINKNKWKRRSQNIIISTTAYKNLITI